MLSQIKHIQSSNIHNLAHILDTCSLIFNSCALSKVYNPHRVTATTRAREGSPKEHRDKQKCPSETHSVTYVPGLSTLSNLSCIVAQLPPSSHPSSLTSVSLVPALHLFPPSIPFWLYGTHPFFAQSKLTYMVNMFNIVQ